MKISSGKKVKMEYELKLDDGEVLESSEARGPIEYLQDAGQMLKGLEDRLVDLEQGDELEDVVPAAEAYGNEANMPTLDIPRAEFPGEVEVAEGTDFQAKDPTGSSVNFTVIEVADDSVKVRLNHPLAGKDIHFKVKILEVSEADPE